jgi:hypothetical protein
MVRKVILFASLLAFGEGLYAQSSLPIQAKGMWIWELWVANGGNLTAVADKLKTVGVTWVVIKMGDSDSDYNSSGKSLYNWASTYGGMDSVVSVFHRDGIKILGYQYVYGAAHWGLGLSEADVANKILSVKGIDGLLVDAEIQYDTLSTRVSSAQSYMDSIRAHHPTSFVGLTSWAYVSVHSTFPWVTFLSRLNVNMPQTYWAARPKTPAAELSKMSSDFTTYTQTWVNQGNTAAAKPIMPLGQAEYFGYGNNVQPSDISSFSSLSQATYKYQGISLWEYTQITSSFVWDEYTAAWPLTSVADDRGATSSYSLSQNFPNPFNPATVISYQISTAGDVTLKVYDLLGREVKTLVNERQNAGSHSVTFDANTLPSGVYFYRLESGTYAEVKKLVLLK